MTDSMSVEANKAKRQVAIDITTLQSLTSKTRSFAGDLSGTFHNHAQTRSDIRSALQRELIYEQFCFLPLGTFLTPEHVHSLWRSTYGLKQWLVAPENGVRNLVSECIKLCWYPIKNTADSIRDAIIQAADYAGEQSSNKKSTATKADKYRDTIIKDAILDGAKAAIQKWHNETLSQLEAMLEAECMRPTPEHFVALKMALLQQLQSPPPTNSSNGNSKLAVSGQSLALASHPISGDQPETSPHTRPKQEWSQFYMGWLEKKNRHGVWQRRWVVISSKQRTAWYFKNPDEVPARAMIKLDNAAIIELPTPPINISGSVVGGRKNSKGAVKDQHRHTFQLVLSHAPVKRGSNNASISNSGQQQQPAIMTFAADTSAVKRQWIEMLGMAGQGLSAADGQNAHENDNNNNNTSLSSQHSSNKFTIPNLRIQQEQEDNGATMVSHEEGDLHLDGPVVKRKISTKVFPQEEGEEEKKNKEASSSSSSSEATTSSTEGKETQEETGEEKERKAALKAAQEAALIADIEQDAAAVAPTDEETKVYQLIITATRKYIQEAHARMADLTGKVVASGMLDRSENELYDDVLEAVLDEHGAAAQALGFLSKV